jgi:hypothetical protein
MEDSGNQVRSKGPASRITFIVARNLCRVALWDQYLRRDAHQSR